MKEFTGITAVVFGILNALTVLLKGGKISEFMAWLGWIALGLMIFL